MKPNLVFNLLEISSLKHERTEDRVLGLALLEARSKGQPHAEQAFHTLLHDMNKQNYQILIPSRHRGCMEHKTGKHKDNQNHSNQHNTPTRSSPKITASLSIRCILTKHQKGLNRQQQSGNGGRKGDRGKIFSQQTDGCRVGEDKIKL